MPNLNGLKNRISVVANTKKITNAMELVSASKLRVIKKEYDNIQNYKNSLENTFSDIMDHMSKGELDTLFPVDKSNESELYIIITSDLGLCGSYNSNIINLARTRVKENDKLILIGNKGISQANKLIKNKENIIKSFAEVGNKFSYELASLIASESFDLYKQSIISKINIIYTKFINNVVQESEIKTLFPLEIKTDHKSVHTEIEFEPSAEEVLKNAIPLYLSSLIYALGAASKLSEMASRRNAMENATDNAQEIEQTLILEYNSTRQGLITQEITEIVSGADAT
ncbi:ATP synthase F1 subunit gamma [Mycoplasma anserisalpingitidis]|nr:ATP synthase F1 subunit gamma [Mycoplasma anserisalpingitidis]QDY87498.1 F0F1 ATP synthase subunit gamma [Mycoplasma anserisalpingitidis]UCU26807.1 F0F1 ATP synthase subunit gamma [Mycoplasma anserisalpingitidis]UCU27646.1 F0F1 ATP synthase subunit gamma [Mycoplasma anserisalpingitidis]